MSGQIEMIRDSNNIEEKASVAIGAPNSLGVSSGRDYHHISKETTTGRWTQEEHQLFLDGLKLYKKQWKQIADLIKSRTVVQIRTHAQKYFQKLLKSSKTDEYDEAFLQEFVTYSNGNALARTSSIDSDESGFEKKTKSMRIRDRSDLVSTSPRMKKVRLSVHVNDKPASPKSVLEPPSVNGGHFFVGVASHDECDVSIGFDDMHDWFNDHLFSQPHHAAPVTTSEFYTQSSINHEGMFVPENYNNNHFADEHKFDEFELAWLAEAVTVTNETPRLIGEANTNIELGKLVASDKKSNESLSPRSREESIATTAEASDLDDGNALHAVTVNDNLKKSAGSISQFDVPLEKISVNNLLSESTSKEIITSCVVQTSVEPITPAVAVVRKRGRPRRILNDDSNAPCTPVSAPSTGSIDKSHSSSRPSTTLADHSSNVWDDEEVMGGLLDAFA